jgi:hypothetical protein
VVDGPSGAGLLATLVANAPANGWEGILLLDQSEGFLVFALMGELKIPLDRDVGRAGCFARGAPGLISVA